MHTPENIAELGPNEILVFGSNLLGQHGGGAAKTAHEKFGARWGMSMGLTGQCYALPTLNTEYEKLENSELKAFVDSLKITAELIPSKTFLLTKVGLGIAGYSLEEIAPLFKDMPSNVIQPKEFVEFNEEAEAKVAEVMARQI